MFISVGVILAGCGKNENAAKVESGTKNQVEISSDPVTLTVFTDTALVDDFANDMEETV